MQTRSPSTTRSSSPTHSPLSRTSTQSSVSFAPMEKKSPQQWPLATSKDVTHAALKLQYLLMLPRKPAVPPKAVDACAWSLQAIRQLQAGGHLGAALDFAKLAQRQAQQLSRSEKNYLKIEIMPLLLATTLITNDRRTFDLLDMSSAHFIMPGGVKEMLADQELQESHSPLLSDFFTHWWADTTLHIANKQPLLRLPNWGRQRPEDKLLAAEKKLSEKLVPTILRSNNTAFIVAIAGSKATALRWAKAYGSDALVAQVSTCVVREPRQGRKR